MPDRRQFHQRVRSGPRSWWPNSHARGVGRLLLPEDVIHRLADDLVERAVLVDHNDYLVLVSALRSQESRLHIALETAQAALGLGLWSARPHDRLAKHDGYLLRLIRRAHLIIHDRLCSSLGRARPCPHSVTTILTGTP